MIWFMIGHLLTILLTWVSIGRLSNQEKDLERLVLGQQVRMLERQLGKPVRPSRLEKLTLAVVARMVRKLRLRHNGTGCFWRELGRYGEAQSDI